MMKYFFCHLQPLHIMPKNCCCFFNIEIRDNTKNIQIRDNNKNIPNVHQARDIEKNRALCKKEYRKVKIFSENT